MAVINKNSYNCGTVRLFGYDINTSLDHLIESDKNKLIINTINPHSYYVAKTDRSFQLALKSSDILLPDGVGIVYSIRLLYGRKIQRIAGYDLFVLLLTYLENIGGNCFFLGSSTTTLEIIKKKMRDDFPNVKMAYYSPPFKEIHNRNEDQVMINKINAFKPDILFVGMTAPKQEKWVYRNNHYIDVRFIGSIGAVFDFYAETKKRSSKFWIKLGLEWLYRFVRQPKHLWRRNLISTPNFIYDVFKEFIISRTKK